MDELPLRGVRAVRDDVLARVPGTVFVGAGDEAIRRLADLARRVTGLDLPPYYVEFLRLMGGAEPTIAFFGDAECSVDAVAESYGYDLEDGDVPAPGCLRIATAGLHVEEVVLRVADGTVWTTDGDALTQRFGDSLLALLNRKALQVTCQQDRRVTLTATAAAGPDVLAAVRAVLDARGWRLRSESVAVCAVSPDDALVVIATRAAVGGTWLAVHGRDRHGVGAVGKELCAAAGLTPERWWGPRR